MMLFRFLIASTCIEERFMSGNVKRDCCFEVESSSFEISVISCSRAAVVLALYSCHSDLSFSKALEVEIS